jgi:cell division protein ZapA
LEQPVKIKILDQEYLVRSQEDSESVQRIARFVNDKFREIEKNAEGLSEKKTAILAAFHIASDYFQVLKERDSLKENIEKRTRALVDRMESASR